MSIIILKAVSGGVSQKIEVSGETRSGGEGTVYFSKDGQYAVKVYHNPPHDKEELLTHVMTLFRSLTPDQTRFIRPPLALVERVDGQSRVGFLMRRVPPTYRELIEFVLSPVSAEEPFRRGITWGSYLKLARSIANAVTVLHSKGCAHSDIHYRNFLANLETGESVMLEIDGVVVEKWLRPQVKGLMGFMAPEILTKGADPSVHTDRHSIAVLILHTLLLRNVLTPLVEYDTDQDRSEQLGWGAKALFSEDRRDRRHCPTNIGLPLYRRGALSYRMLTLALQKLTERALCEGLVAPDQRPLANEWEEALARAVDELWMCQRCKQHFPYQFWTIPAARRSCPFCGERMQFPYPTVLSLHEERGKHSYLPIGQYVLVGQGFRVFSDVAQPHRLPPMTRLHEKSIASVEWDEQRRQHRLVNEDFETWTALMPGGSGRVHVSKGESVPLAKGVLLSFGLGKRLALVTEGADGR